MYNRRIFFKKKGLQFIRTGDLYLAAVKSDIVISDK